MPRLLPSDWIKQVAIYYLLELYENNRDFVKQWEQVKYPYTLLIRQLAKVRTLLEINEFWMNGFSGDLFGWLQDLQRLRDYLRVFPPQVGNAESQVELENRDARISEELNTYLLSLNDLAHRWNIRAPWAAEELLDKDVQKIQDDILKGAGVTRIIKLSDEQIQAYLRRYYPLLPLDSWPINILSLYSAGGRQKLQAKFRERLTQFELRLKTGGAKEPPSALKKHTEWWFDHYVNNMDFEEIANKIAQTDPDGGPQPENIRKAVEKFSELANIHPMESRIT